jgi:hypothetical protein
MKNLLQENDFIHADRRRFFAIAQNDKSGDGKYSLLALSLTSSYCFAFTTV